MTITITEEQVSYIKGLDSKKKQRKFLLDCLVEQITSIGKSVKISELPFVIPLSQDEFMKAFNFEKGHPWYSTTSKEVEAKFNTLAEKYMPKEDELLKFDAMEEVEEKRNYKLSEIVDKVVRESIDEIAKKKYTEEDMLKCFNASREMKTYTESACPCEKIKFNSFAEYLDSLEK